MPSIDIERELEERRRRLYNYRDFDRVLSLSYYHNNLDNLVYRAFGPEKQNVWHKITI